MTSTEARKILQKYINEKVRQHGFFTLPIKDIIIPGTRKIDEENGSSFYSILTWSGLIKVAYPVTSISEH